MKHGLLLFTLCYFANLVCMEEAALALTPPAGGQDGTTHVEDVRMSVADARPSLSAAGRHEIDLESGGGSQDFFEITIPGKTEEQRRDIIAQLEAQDLCVVGPDGRVRVKQTRFSLEQVGSAIQSIANIFFELGNLKEVISGESRARAEGQTINDIRWIKLIIGGATATILALVPQIPTMIKAFSAN